MSIHILKTAPEPWAAMRDGTKRFEHRRDDRDFQVGDILQLEYFHPEPPGPELGVGGILRCKVTYLLRGGEFGVADGYCLMSTGEVEELL